MEGIAETAKLFSQSKAKSPITKSVVYDGRLSWVLSMSEVHNVLHDADTHVLSTVSMLTSFCCCQCCQCSQSTHRYRWPLLFCIMKTCLRGPGIRVTHLCMSVRNTTGRQRRYRKPEKLPEAAPGVWLCAELLGTSLAKAAQDGVQKTSPLSKCRKYQPVHLQ